jgi:hypothetical protein
MLIKDFTQYKHYRKLDNPIVFNGFEIVGWFPYETASVSSDNIDSEIVRVPRGVYSHIEEKCNQNHISGNKIVIICRDTVRFGTNDFAIFFKDMYAKISNLENVRGYGMKQLEVI